MRVNEESLLAGDRVSADNRVLGGDGFTTSNASSSNTVVDLLNTGMDSSQAVKSLAELRRQAAVGQRHVCEERVTTASRTVKQVQECSAGGLFLEGHIRVPCHGVGMTFQELRTAAVLGSTMDKMDFRETLRSARGLMNMVTAEVAAEFDGLVNRKMSKILVTEGYV